MWYFAVSIDLFNARQHKDFSKEPLSISHGSFEATSLEMYSRTNALQCKGRTSDLRFVTHFCTEDKRTLPAIPSRCKLY